MADYKSGFVNKVNVNNTDVPISYVETEYKDTTNNFSNYKGDFAKRKVYTGVIGTDNNYAGAAFFFGEVTPLDYYAQWSVHYHVNVHLDNESLVISGNQAGQLCRGSYEVYISGTRGIYCSFACFNNISNTDYRPIYYHILHCPTQAGFNLNYPNLLGIELTSSYQRVNTDASRTVEITLISYENCNVTLKDSLIKYGNLNSTYYINGSSNSAGYFTRFSCTSNGLQELGDDNTYNRITLSNGWTVNNSSFNNGGSNYLTGYSLLGFDRNGNALGFSLRTPTATSYDTAIQETRVYEENGFDYTRGMRYMNTSRNYPYRLGSGTSTDPYVYCNLIRDNYESIYCGFDLRYTDNCIANANATTLGMLPRKPVYFRGTIGEDGLFYLAPISVTYNNKTYKRAWTQDVPTTEDGYFYWFIGIPYYNATYTTASSRVHSSDNTTATLGSLYQMVISESHPLYYYKDGAFKEYIPVESGETYTASKGITITSGNDIQHTNNITAYTGTPSLQLLQYDAQGHITSAVTVSPNRGINLDNSNKIGHSNSVTAQTTQALYPVKIDAQGHISAYGTAVTSLPANGGNADTVDNKHASDFLGATATATDSSKLGGSLPAYFLDYTHLSNTPTIPAAQVQSNWTQSSTTAVDYIKNKPTSFTPSAHATTTTTYGIGTAASGSGASAVAGQYGHVMLISGDLNGVTYTDGKAAASSHTHSQYITGLTSSSVEPVGSIAYVASITNTPASESGTTVAITGIDGGSGGFTPTSKYIRLTGSAGFSSSVTRYAKVVDGTALTSKVDKYLKFTAGTTPVSSSSFSGSATTALVTDLTATVTGSTLELSVVHGTYTPQGTITHTRGTAPGLTSTTDSSGNIAYVESASSGNTGVKFQTCTSASGTYLDATYLTYVQSVSGTGSIKLQTGISPTTTSANWTTVGTTGTVFIESATHDHTSATVTSTATVVTGVTGGTTDASTKYLKGSN